MIIHKYGQPELDLYCESPALGLVKSCYDQLSKAELAYLHGIVHNVKGSGDKGDLKKAIAKLLLAVNAVASYYGTPIHELPNVQAEELEAMI